MGPSPLCTRYLFFLSIFISISISITISAFISVSAQSFNPELAQRILTLLFPCTGRGRENRKKEIASHPHTARIHPHH